jgi:hypothetical protein
MDWPRPDLVDGEVTTMTTLSGPLIKASRAGRANLPLPKKTIRKGEGGPFINNIPHKWLGQVQKTWKVPNGNQVFQKPKQGS